MRVCAQVLRAAALHPHEAEDERRGGAEGRRPRGRRPLDVGCQCTQTENGLDVASKKGEGSGGQFHYSSKSAFLVGCVQRREKAPVCVLHSSQHDHECVGLSVCVSLSGLSTPARPRASRAPAMAGSDV